MNIDKYYASATVRAGLRLLALVGMLMLAACDGADPDLPSRLRIVNASGASSVDVYENLDLLTRVGAEAVSPYLDVEPGTTLLEARAESGRAVTAQVLLVPDSVYTVVVAGPPEALTLLFMTDRRTTPSGGRASVRLLHAAPQTGVLDVEIVPDAAGGDSTTVEGLAVTELTSFFPLAPGAYTLFIDDVGGNRDAAPRIDLQVGRRYLLVVTDAGGSRTLRVLVAEQ